MREGLQITEKAQKILTNKDFYSINEQDFPKENTEKDSFFIFIEEDT